MKQEHKSIWTKAAVLSEGQEVSADVDEVAVNDHEIDVLDREEKESEKIKSAIDELLNTNHSQKAQGLISNYISNTQN